MAIGTDPFADLLTLQRDMDRIMTKFGGQARMTGEEGRSFWMPPVDVYKQGADMVLRVELPGVNPSDINVSITGNMLSVRGERRQDRQVDESDYVMRETTYGSFERRITLPEDVEAGQVRAQYRAGVLEIVVPNSAMIAPQSRQVQVSGGGTQTLGTGQQAGQQTMAQPVSSEGQQQYPGGQQQYTGAQAGYGQQEQGYQQPSQQYAGSQQSGQTGGGGYATQQQQPPQAQAEGGWVQPQGEQPGQPTGGERPEQRKPSGEDEHAHRTKLGGWLHGDK